MFDVMVEIINIDCFEEFYGIFEGGDMIDFGFEWGLFLIFGSCDYVVGFNIGGGGGSLGMDNGVFGDVDFDYFFIVFGEGIIF